MKKAIALLTAISASTLCANAAITYVHTYKLGETGSIIDGKPQDGTGSAHFTTADDGGSTTQTSGAGAASSTAYASFNQQGAYGADFSGFATNNFGIEMWARTNGATGTDTLFTTGEGSVTFGIHDGNWYTSLSAGAWVGHSPIASGNPQTNTANTWTHLAIIRNNGVSTFYINGVAQTGTSSTAPSGHGTGRLGHEAAVDASTFEGDLDELRMFTFEDGDDPVGALNLEARAAVPEPSSTALLGLGSLALILRRRK